METVWYVYRDGKQLGPLSYEQFKAFYGNLPIQEGDLFWKEGMPSWEAVSDAILGRQTVMSTPTVVLQPPSSEIIEKIPEPKIEPPSLQNVQTPQPVLTPEPITQPVVTQAVSPVINAIPDAAPFAPAPIVSQSQPEIAATETPEVVSEPTLSGLGGWSILLVLGSLKVLFFSFIGLIWLISNLSGVLGTEGTIPWKVLIYALTAIFGALMAVLWTFNLNKNLFLKKKIFPAQFRALLGLPLVLLSAMLIFGFMQRSGTSRFLTPYDLPILSTKSVSFFGLTFTPEALTLGICLVGIIIIALLTLYTSRSKRVKNTFVH